MNLVAFIFLNLKQTSNENKLFYKNKDVQKFVADMETYKAASPLDSGSEGDKTLTYFHFIILPIWWSDYDIDDPDLLIDSNQIEGIMQQSQDYYKDMSWGTMDVTFEIMAQTHFSVSSDSPDFDNTYEAARTINADAGYVEDVDYNAIGLVYFPSQNGPFSGGGGWGSVNGNFMWNSYPTDYAVTRHESK